MASATASVQTYWRQEWFEFEDATYLNLAGQSPLPRVSVRAVQAALEAKKFPHHKTDATYFEVPNRIRENIARLIGGKPEEIGHKVAAALVGTFLGILLCYGLIGPLAANMAKTHEAERAYYQMLRAAMSAFNKGIPPMLAVEVGRRTITLHCRPSFQEVEKTCRNRGAAAQPQAA